MILVTGSRRFIGSASTPGGHMAGNGPSVAVLLCTYNGEAHLAEQLESIAAQTHGHWTVWASDDGSTDGTREILRDHARRWGEDRLRILDGPAQGHTRNFMSLVRHGAIQADYYAFADQDDIWEAGKLERALTRLSALPAGVPRLYGARTRNVDQHNAEVGMSPLFRRPPGFENALTQNIAGGNTMVFDHGARALLAQTDPAASVVTHDWLAYLVVTGCGGMVVYDPVPSVRYRQHDRNAIGAGQGWRAGLRRWHGLGKGQNQNWHRANSEALQPLVHALTARNRRLLLDFDAARDQGLLARLRLLHGCGLYRQTGLQTLSLYVAMVLNRL